MLQIWSGGRKEAHISIVWQPGIGDPTLTAWLTVFAYLATAAMCWRASTKARAWNNPQIPTPKIEARFWIFASAFMAFLSFNKQLDLQTLATQIARYAALSGGWYDQRHSVQLGFILALVIAAVIVGSILLWAFRRLVPEIRMASIGVCFLVAFIVIRAASFHHADRFLGQNIIGVRWNAVLEIGGIIFVAAAGFWYLKKRPTGG